MGHMPVPWAVGGGAVNSEALARMIPYFMFGGQEGILQKSDLQVQALATPGTSIRVAPGGYSVVGRGSGQQYESYLGKVTTEDVVPISATGGSGRSDLVIARIEDPNISGEPWADPGDVQVGPYAFTRIIENVPSTTRSVRQLGNNFSAITLARIDIPSSTGTITQGMIKDLRSLCNPVTGSAPEPTIPCPENEDTPEVTEKLWTDAKANVEDCPVLTNSYTGSWVNWPAPADWIIPVPSWATGADVLLIFANLEYDNDIWGDARVQITNGGSTNIYMGSSMYDVNYHGGPGPERIPIVLAGTMGPFPAAIRGKNTRFRTQFKLRAGSPTHTGHLSLSSGTTLYMSVNFKQFPIYE